MSSLDYIRTRNVLVHGAVTLDLRSDHGDQEFLFLEHGESGIAESLARSWGEELSARSVRYQVGSLEPVTVSLAEDGQ